MHRCKLQDNEEGAVVGMNSSMLMLTDCHIQNTKGAAVELSSAAQVCMHRGSTTQCTGMM